MKIRVNTIKNPDTMVEAHIFNDKDILSNVISYEKENVSLYSIAMGEASNQTLYETLFEMYTETQNMQRALHNLMFKKGWYTIDIEEKDKLLDSHSQYSEYINKVKH